MSDTIYKSKDGNAHRRVWESINGPIPKDENGRSYEIHHIDGNHKNNDIENLMCVTIQDHYKIHYEQGDFVAAYRILQRMEISPEELSKQQSKLMKKENKKRVDKGTHNWLKSNENPNMKYGCRGDSEFLSKVAKKRVAEGTHNFLGGEYNRKRIADGTHNLLKCKGTVPCYDKFGKYVRVEKTLYHSIDGNMKDREYVHMHSKEGKRRKEAYRNS